MKEIGVIASTLNDGSGLDDMQKPCKCGCACTADIQFQAQLVWD